MGKNDRVSVEAARADELGGRLMEEVRSLSWTTLEARFGTIPINVPLPADMQGGVTYNPQLVVTDLPGNLAHIQLTVTWTDAGATPGAEGGRFDHSLALEFIRNRTDRL